MDYYKKYYSVYEEIEPKIISAAEQSNTHPLWHLWGDIETLISTVNNCKLDCNDDVGDNFSTCKSVIIKSLNDNFNNLKSYDTIDHTYCDLLENLNNLKENATKLQTIFLKKPALSNYKYHYYAFDESTQTTVSKVGYHTTRFNNDLIAWQKEMDNFEAICDVISFNINELLDFLKNANSTILTEDITFSLPSLINIDSINPELGLTCDEILIRTEYSLPLDTDISVIVKTEIVNGFKLKYVSVYDNNLDGDEQRKNFDIFVQDSINRIRNSGIKKEVLESISEYNLVFDESYLCDTYSNSFGYFPVGGYFDGKNIKAHFFPERFYRDDLGNIVNEADYYDTTAAILHEMGHGFDNVTKEEEIDSNYSKIILEAEEAGKPLYVRTADIQNPDGTITSRNNYYREIHYESDGSMYVLDDNGKRIDFSSLDETISMNNDTYVVASAQEAQGHCGEVAAEIFRYTNIDPLLIEERRKNDDSYVLVGTSLGNRLKNYGEAVTWLDNIGD